MISPANHQPPLSGSEQDAGFMALAIAAAQRAWDKAEVPVGAVLVFNNQVIASAHNAPISQQDPTAHAEIRCLRQAALQLANYRLPGTTLYVTLEPCLMCAGALVHARIQRLVFATPDPKSGVITSCDQVLSKPYLNHTIEVQQGLLAEQASQLLKSFFAERRKQK